jgi:hypothetical protein
MCSYWYRWLAKNVLHFRLLFFFKISIGFHIKYVPWLLTNPATINGRFLKAAQQNSVTWGLVCRAQGSFLFWVCLTLFYLCINICTSSSKAPWPQLMKESPLKHLIANYIFKGDTLSWYLLISLTAGVKSNFVQGRQLNYISMTYRERCIEEGLQAPPRLSTVFL